MKLGLSQRKKYDDSMSKADKPYVMEIAKLDPGDYIILKFPKYENIPHTKAVKYIENTVKRLKTKFPHNNIIALSDGIEMEVLRQWP